METFIKKLLKLSDNPTSAHPPAAFLLSDDILISIFMLNVEQLVNVNDRMDVEISSHDFPTLQCTTRRTSQVCRHWRLVALTCPALWSNIELSRIYAQWNQEMINRATRPNGFGRLSLACYNRQALSQITPELLSHAYSYYGIVSTKVWSMLTNELMSPITKLDSLFVFSSFIEDDFANLISTPPLMLDKPCLKRLSFDSRIPVDITHSNLSLITTLVAGYLPSSFIDSESEVPQFTIPEILSTLANMPLLQELSLDGLCEEDIAHPVHSINLPFLARLQLSGSYLSNSLLLNNIDFPLSCTLRVLWEEIRWTTLAPPTTDMIYRVAAPVAKHMAYGFTRNLHITLEADIVYIKEILPIPNTIPSNRKDSGWYSELKFKSLSLETVAKWIVVLDQTIPIFRDIFQTTTHLTLWPSIDRQLHPSALVLNVLRPFIALSVIHLNGYTISTNLASLLKSTNENGEEVLPVLRKIELSELTVDTLGLDDLIDFLAWRLERNKGVHTFEFHFDPGEATKSIFLTKKQLLRLQQSVVDVDAYFVKVDYSSRNLNRWRLAKAEILHSIWGNCRLGPFREGVSEY